MRVGGPVSALLARQPLPDGAPHLLAVKQDAVQAKFTAWVG
jgi:hypothetical protein